MTLDKNIFDKYQKSLLDENYVDLDNLSSVVYMDEALDIKPMTLDDYSEMSVSFSSSLDRSDDTIKTATGVIVEDFAKSAHTLTSFSNATKNMTLGNASNNSGFYFSEKEDGLSFVNKAIMASVGSLSPEDILLGKVFNSISDMVTLIPSITALALTTVTALTSAVSTAASGLAGVIGGAGNALGGFGKNVLNGIQGKGYGDLLGDLSGDAKKGYDVTSSAVSSVLDPITGLFNSSIAMGQVAVVTYSDWLSSSISLISDTFTNVYKDGVTETNFGQKMERTWRMFVSSSTSDVYFNQINNPLTNLGTEPILFGAPPRYTSLSDPRDRSYINTFIKDGNILSIIPGKPKYNGLSLGKVNLEKSKNKALSGVKSFLDQANSGFSSFLNDSGMKNIKSGITDDIGKQTTAEEYAGIALDYLKRNGISDVFNENDKRYYTFESDYDGYYSYLETMLNTIYTRMGLGEMADGKNELFSFFTGSGTEQETLIERFNGKSLGFYFEGNPSVSESMSNSTSDPANLKSAADSMSEEFQRINYVTGFGKNTARKAGIASARITKIGEAIGDVLGGATGKNTFSKLTSVTGSSMLTGLAGLGDKMMGALSYSSNMDLNAITESMLSTNGMKTEFPNLWSDSNYSKSISVDFEFISPYGDPLSIFQYCYVPLCSILSLALPKQAEENGYVNPFFLRMDIPGVISSDFAIISNITWVRGGTHNLWTVDKHPRAISVSVTFEDLYTFLAMTKRISFLSANPNYSMFLDSFSGIRSLYPEGNSINNDYWNLLVNRLNSNNSYADTLWNQTDVDKTINEYLSTSMSSEQQFFKNYYKRDISWMKSK